MLIVLLDAWFDFLANVPESQHAGMMLLSDYATPDGNHFSAYGCHTFRWVNAKGDAVFVKVIHTTPTQAFYARIS